MTILETLKAVRMKITPKKCWTQGALARNLATNRPVKPNSPKASAWCMEGAIRAVNPNGALMAIKGNHWPVNFCAQVFNDSHTHAEVLAVIDAAIASIKSIGNQAQQ